MRQNNMEKKNFDYTVFEEAKEISKKDLKVIRKLTNKLRKKGFAISPRPKKKSNKANEYYFPKLRDLVVNEEGHTSYGEWIEFKKVE